MDVGIFRFLYKVYFGFVFVLSGVVLYPYFLIALSGDRKLKRAKKVKKVWAKTICFIAFIRVHVIDKENFPVDAPYVVCANHASYLDIIVMFLIIPHDFAFMGKAELLKWPLIHIFFKRGIDIPVYRNNRKKAGESILAANESLRNGRSIAIFPEGKMVENPPIMSRFKNGAFSMAIEHKVPIVPITFINNYQLFSDHTDVFGAGSPGKAKIKIHRPIKVDEATDLLSLRDQTFKTIQSALILNS